MHKYVLLILVCIIGLYYRQINWQMARNWPDEKDTIELIENNSVINSLTLHGQPPLYYYLAKHSRTIGDLFELSHIESLRWFSIIVSVFGIIAAYFLGKVFFDDSNYALLTSWVMANSWLSIYYAQEIRMYSLLGLVSTISLIFFWRYLKGFRSKDLLVLTIINILLVSIHTFGNLLIILEISFLVLKEFTNRRMKILSSVILMLIPSLLFFYMYLPGINQYGKAVERNWSIYSLLIIQDQATDLWTQVRLLRWLTGIEKSKLFLVTAVTIFLCQLRNKQKSLTHIFVVFIYLSSYALTQFLISTHILHYFANRHFIFVEPVFILLVPAVGMGLKDNYFRKMNIEYLWYLLSASYFAYIGLSWFWLNPIHYNNIP